MDRRWQIVFLVLGILAVVFLALITRELDYRGCVAEQTARHPPRFETTEAVGYGPRTITQHLVNEVEIYNAINECGWP